MCVCMSVCITLLLIIIIIIFIFLLLEWKLRGILSSRTKVVRHTRVLGIRLKIAEGWSMDDLMKFCFNNLKVSKQTAISYIDEAAAPYRRKFQEQNNVTT